MNAGGIFGGIGGSLLGAKWAGFDVRFNIEPRKFFNDETFTHNFPGAYSSQYLDMYEEIQGEPISLIIGSPDCKQFSNLGTKRKDRGRLHEINPMDFDYVKFLVAMQKLKPTCFILENVPNVLKTFWFEDNSLMFKGNAHSVLSLPYYDIQTVVLNAKEFGVPQSRKRAFIIGSRLFKPEFNFEKLLKTDYILLHNRYNRGEKLKNVLDIRDGVPNHVKPNHSLKRIQGFAKLKIGESYYGTQNNLRLDPEKHAGTIASHCSRFVHPFKSRVLTARENARIMGFPDHFKFFGNETGQLDQIGKSIVPHVSMAISYYLKQEIENATQRV